MELLLWIDLLDATMTAVPIDVSWALHGRIRGDFQPCPGWSITKTTPRSPVWAKSRHGSARVTHRVRFQVTATETIAQPGCDRESLTFTVWRCGGRATDWRGIEIMADPVAARRPLKDRCYGCEKPEEPR